MLLKKPILKLHFDILGRVILSCHCRQPLCHGALVHDMSAFVGENPRYLFSETLIYSNTVFCAGGFFHGTQPGHKCNNMHMLVQQSGRDFLKSYVPTGLGNELVLFLSCPGGSLFTEAHF